ncbi:MAG: hypothetical protein IKZ34_02580 [Alphaproteobacteria bacterium]|nr:hypothetical protein [Alphaproteobacteria bacterium]
MNNNTETQKKNLAQEQEMIATLFKAIKRNTVRYTAAGQDGISKQCYSLQSPSLYVSTMKVEDEHHLTPTKFMMNVEFKADHKRIQCSGEIAKKVYLHMREKYERVLKRTRLVHSFCNPAFAKSHRTRG